MGFMGKAGRNLDVRSFLGFCIWSDTASTLDEQLAFILRAVLTLAMQDDMTRKMMTKERTWTFSTLMVGMRLDRNCANTETASLFPPPWLFSLLSVDHHGNEIGKDKKRDEWCLPLYQSSSSSLLSTGCSKVPWWPIFMYQSPSLWTIGGKM